MCQQGRDFFSPAPFILLPVKLLPKGKKRLCLCPTGQCSCLFKDLRHLWQILLKPGCRILGEPFWWQPLTGQPRTRLTVNDRPET